MNVLYEDDYIIVCEKPAGIASQAGKITDKDMVSEVNNYMRRAGAKASAYLIHRLDKPVRGILVFAKTKQAAAKLNSQLTGGDFCKKYYAIVEGKPESEEGILENYMYKDSKNSKAVIVGEKETIKEAKAAKLSYKVVSKYNESKSPSVLNDEKEAYLLDIRLFTGRFHQIRCQLSNMGHPIVGDTLYGASIPYKKRNAIGLIAYSLSFMHPISNKELCFNIEL